MFGKNDINESLKIVCFQDETCKKELYRKNKLSLPPTYTVIILVVDDSILAAAKYLFFTLE